MTHQIAVQDNQPHAESDFYPKLFYKYPNLLLRDNYQRAKLVKFLEIAK